MDAPVGFAGVMRALAAQAAAFEALLLLASVLHKASQWAHFKQVVQEFAGVRAALVSPVLACVGALEAGAAALLLTPALRTPGALLAAGVWCAYLALIVRAILQGRRDADCGCSFGPAQRPLGTYQVARNLGLTGLAIAVALAAPAGDGLGDRGFEVLAAFALLALYGALDQVMALRPLRDGRVS
jgi:hypothetical protein